MTEEGTQQLPYVQETVLKKRKKVNENWAVKNQERKAAKGQRHRDDGKGAIKRPEDFFREFRNKELDFHYGLASTHEEDFVQAASDADYEIAEYVFMPALLF
ncbi:hypothetical protein GUJ93_ZPchr0010g8793 [Zizania palustris]|uniref:Uncharacterized protein n=1 Tax=Zizania palustris TaxID=103762 RepID=A0A8J5WDQ8_ZIZPA|nr:hypothetical protein GUJ93_ZPchr0010g8793 [Zizania palustris]